MNGFDVEIYIFLVIKAKVGPESRFSERVDQMDLF